MLSIVRNKAKYMPRPGWGAAPPTAPLDKFTDEWPLGYVIVSHSVILEQDDTKNYCRTVKMVQNAAFQRGRTAFIHYLICMHDNTKCDCKSMC